MRTDRSLTFRANLVAREAADVCDGEPRTAGQVATALCRLSDAMGRFEDELHQIDPPKGRIACRAGCSACCHMRIVVTPFELAFLAEFIRDQFSSTQLEDLRLRLAETDELTRGMSDEERGRAQIYCPLLVDDKCSAYPARPFECRGYLSMNVDACRRSAKNYDEWDVPMYFSQYTLYKTSQAGLKKRGGPIELLELTAGLRIAIEDPNAIEQWLSGEDSFRDARIPASDRESEAFLVWTPSFKPLDGDPTSP